ncbi:hypothetical protein HPGCJGGD_3744 [Methylobacterium haplocladii]|nr:hypothetical protein HPGCJGGD_3744 [Methylobacterium haplocladii]
MAVVAEHDVGIRVGRAGVDHVAAEAADHEVGARAGRDGVGRAAVAVARRFETDPVAERDGAVVAEDDVRAAARGDRVGARTAEDDVCARAGIDDVVATESGIHGLGEGNPAEDVEGDVAVVAEHDVGIAVEPAGIDAVGPEAADHEVGAGTGHDRIAATTAGTLAERLEADTVHEVDGAVVAEHDVVADARGDGVVARAAEHDVGAVARADGVVARDALVLRCDTDELALREGGLTVIAEDHVAAGAGGDVVGADAAEHDVVALAGQDQIAAAEGRFEGFERDQHAVEEDDAAVVAEDHVRAGSGDDLVGTDAADDDAAAVAQGDLVAGARGGGRGRGLHDAAQGVERGLAVVAEHDGASVAGRDEIAARAAENHAVAVADRDDVAAADVVVGGLDDDRQARRGEAGVTGVTEDHVRTVAGRDAVAAGTGDDGVSAAAELDRVPVAHLRAGTGDLDDGAGLEIGLSAVAEDDVAAIADGDAVAAVAAQHDVVAVANLDGVVAADRRVGRERAQDPAEGIEGDDAVVAEDHRALVGALDDVAGRAAEHDVGARTEGDRVGAADRGSGRGDACELARRHPVQHGHGEVGLAAVAEDDVVARAGGDRVGTRAADDPGIAVLRLDGVGTADVGRDRLDALGASVAEHGLAAVAEDDVVARADLDDVRARTAEDDGVAARRRDRVVAADLGSHRGDRRDQAVLEGGRAAVAEHDLRALAQRDRVGAGTAQRRHVAVVRGDRVVAADARIDALDRDETAGREQRPAVVAEDDVVARAHRDPVRAGTAEDRGVAVLGRDRVAAAGISRDRGHGGDLAVLEGRGAAVAEHDLRTRAERDRIRTGTADDGDVAVGRRDGVAAADARIDALDRDETAGREQRHAAVAEDDVVARADLDDVRAEAAENGGVAILGRDRVVAAGPGRDRGHGGDHAVREGCRSTVAEHDLTACAQGDLVGTGAADDGDVAVGRRDDVVAAHRRIEALDRGELAGREQRHAVVAEDDVVARADLDDVSAEAAEDGRVAVLGFDRVTAADLGGDGGDGGDLPVHEGRRAAVAEDDLRALAERDLVRTGAADDGDVAFGRVDDVVAADRGLVVGRLDRGQDRDRHDDAADAARAGHEGRRAGVAQDHLRSRADGDAVLAGAADDRGVAVGRLDRVVAADRAVDAAQARQDAAREQGFAVVAEDDVVARARGDLVGAEAAEDDVVAVRRRDRVAAADARVGRHHAADDVGAVQCDPGGRRAVLVDLAVVADEDVRAGLGVDGVGARSPRLVEEGIGDRHDAADVVEVQARIAEDDVGGGAAGDRVVPGAATDDVAALATGDRVVARAAVDDDEARGARSVDDVVEADRTSVGSGRALVTECEGAAGRLLGRRVVAAAVGRGVAEQGEGALGAGDLDGVGTAAAMDRRQRVERRARDRDIVSA